MADAATEYLNNLAPEDVQSVSSSGVSIALRDPNETAQKKWGLIAAQTLTTGLTRDDVQSVSSAGLSVTLRDSADVARKQFELERDQRRAAFNPLMCGNFRDGNQRRR